MGRVPGKEINTFNGLIPDQGLERARKQREIPGGKQHGGRKKAGMYRKHNLIWPDRERRYTSR